MCGLTGIFWANLTPLSLETYGNMLSVMDTGFRNITRQLKSSRTPRASRPRQLRSAAVAGPRCDVVRCALYNVY